MEDSSSEELQSAVCHRSAHGGAPNPGMRIDSKGHADSPSAFGHMHDGSTPQQNPMNIAHGLILDSRKDH